MAKKTTKKEVEAIEEATEEATELSIVPDKLPKGVDQETYNNVKAVIVSGFTAGATPDAIKSEIFSSGVPFSKLSLLYSIITKAEGLIIDPKVISEGITNALQNSGIDFEMTYATLAAVAEEIIGEVNGATMPKVIAAMKALFKENEVEFPRKPAPTRGRMGVVNKTLIDVFYNDKEASQKDCYNALAEVTKTLKNADDYSKQFHKMLYAVANGMSTLQVLSHFSSDK